tara:strand:+ start:925 stop:1857 length:933 start_codon:yes stop_codon:yes gene_type:complete
MILNKGEIINNTYEVIFFIGSGSFGEVYRVKHKFFKDLHAMKIFKEDHVKKNDLDEIISEGRILTKLNHKNIVKVYDINIFNKNNNNYYYITMGFISGESLSQLLNRKIYLDQKAGISIIADILEGITHANNQGLLAHRDLSPDNILLSYQDHKPTAIITDFGIAVILDNLNLVSDSRGKLLYMAPETLSFNVTTQSSDVFSIGVVFYKLLTGVHPWEYKLDNIATSTPENTAGMINISRNSAPIKPSAFNKTVDKSVDEIVLKAIERNMDNRFKNAEEFLSELNSIQVGKNKIDAENHYWQNQNLSNSF